MFDISTIFSKLSLDMCQISEICMGVYVPDVKKTKKTRNID